MTTARWYSEACEIRRDPGSGARLLQLTSSALTSLDIYGETPYASPDGSRIAIVRRRDITFDRDWKLLVADVNRLRIIMIEERGVLGIGCAPWSGQLHYLTDDNRFWRLDLMTLEKTELWRPPTMRLVDRGMTVSPDGRYVIDRLPLPGPDMAVMLADLEARTERELIRHPELVNPHVQVEPVNGDKVLVLHNRGSKADKLNRVTKPFGDAGPTYFVLGMDGTRLPEIPIGRPFTGPCTGHANWIAGTGRVAFTTLWQWETGEFMPPDTEGNLYVAGPGDEAPRLIPTPEHRFNHINVSRCGTYAIVDSFMPPPFDEQGWLRRAAIVVVNLRTGKYRILVGDPGSTGGGGEHQHVHPYMTADNRHVIYHANAGNAPTQVYAAAIPDDFLPSLD